MHLVGFLQPRITMHGAKNIKFTCMYIFIHLHIFFFLHMVSFLCTKWINWKHEVKAASVGIPVLQILTNLTDFLLSFVVRTRMSPLVTNYVLVLIGIIGKTLGVNCVQFPKYCSSCKLQWWTQKTDLNLLHSLHKIFK